MTVADPAREITEDTELEVVPDRDEFYFCDTPDQKLRAFIASYMANAEIDGRILVENMEKVFVWVKDGTVPKAEKLRRPKVVEKEETTS